MNDEPYPFFRVVSNDKIGDGWLCCHGQDDDNKQYGIITNQIHASQAHHVLQTAKIDAELLCRLLNEHFTKKYIEAVQVDLFEYTVIKVKEVKNE